MIVAVRGGRAAVVGAAPPPVAGRALGKGALARSRYFTHEKALPDEAANVSRFGMEGSGFELPVPLRALFCAFADADETNLPGQGFRDRKFADSSLEREGFELSVPLCGALFSTGQTDTSRRHAPCNGESCSAKWQRAKWSGLTLRNCGGSRRQRSSANRQRGWK